MRENGAREQRYWAVYILLDGGIEYELCRCDTVLALLRVVGALYEQGASGVSEIRVRPRVDLRTP